MYIEAYSTNEIFGLELNSSRFVSLDELIPWFENEYKIHELINEFWGLNSKSRLVAVSKDIRDQSWKGLVSEWDTSTTLTGQFRINKPLIEGLLKNSLGDDDRSFKLQNITQLELSIFENFFVELENFWKDYWRVVMPNSNGTYAYLIWAIELDNKEIGSLSIGVPPGIGPKILREKPVHNFRAIASNLDISVPLDLTVGKSKLKITDIKNLETGDLIVFENSDADYLVWKKSDLEKLFIKVQIPGKDNPRFSNLFYDGFETAEMAEENFSEDLLTDLPVELTAQFKSVQMPLQKIIELESGGILPLGLLMDSQLTLVAPGDKAIASGNLVIVGNQFGIKINKTNIKKPVTAKMNYAALENTAAAPRKSTPGPARGLASGGGFESPNSDQNLDKELEDIGLDPKELDELDELY